MWQVSDELPPNVSSKERVHQLIGGSIKGCIVTLLVMGVEMDSKVVSAAASIGRPSALRRSLS
jgi:hypothetical protein